MNFLTSIVRKALRQPGEAINILVKTDNPHTLEYNNITFFTSVMPGVDYDVVVADEKHLAEASQFAMGNHISLLKSEVLNEPKIVEILRSEAKRPYLGHPYEN